MSTQPVVPVAAPAAKKSAIQILEAEIGNWVREKEQTLENLKAIHGALQGAQRLLALLRAEEEKAVVEAKTVESAVKSAAVEVKKEL